MWTGSLPSLRVTLTWTLPGREAYTVQPEGVPYLPTHWPLLLLFAAVSFTLATSPCMD